MPVDEEVQRVLDYYATLGAPPLTALSPEAARRRPTIVDAVNGLRQQRGETVEPEAVGAVRDEVIQGPEGAIRARIYRAEASGPLPLLMYFHDGGWMLGDLDQCDATCRALANLARCVVVSVAYRLAPEHRFPAAVQDAYAATQWAAAAAAALGADPLRLAVCGEGAGGNLAAVVALMARDSNTRAPIYQVLVYPILNDAFDTPSYAHQAYVRPLTKREMRWFWNHYLPEAKAGANSYASPLRAEDVSDLPPGLILTAEYDVLRDEGEAYGRRLEAAGVPMVVRRRAGMTHGFLDMAPVVEEARKGLLEIAGWLQAAFQVSPTLRAAEERPLSGGQVAPAEMQEGLHMAGMTEKVASVPLEGGLLVRVGMEVVSSDGQHMGTVKAVRAGDFVIDRRFRRDVVAPFEAIQEAGERVVLNVPARDVTKMNWAHPSL